MKAVPLTIHWHEHNQPIYSAHFEPNGKGRLATAGGDNNVRVCLIYTSLSRFFLSHLRIPSQFYFIFIFEGDWERKIERKKEKKIPGLMCGLSSCGKSKAKATKRRLST